MPSLFSRHIIQIVLARVLSHLILPLITRIIFSRLTKSARQTTFTNVKRDNGCREITAYAFNSVINPLEMLGEHRREEPVNHEPEASDLQAFRGEKNTQK